MVLLNPNSAVAIDTPLNEKTSTGFLPIRSAARPQESMRSICVRENVDSYPDQLLIYIIFHIASWNYLEIGMEITKGGARR